MAMSHIETSDLKLSKFKNATIHSAHRGMNFFHFVMEK